MAAITTSAGRWLQRWDAQQQLHIPDREERFDAIISALAAFTGANPRVLDLGSGPGSLSSRVLERIPGAEVIAIDTDPVLLELGRSAFEGDNRLHFVDADLRDDWPAQLPRTPPFDAAVSTTALHWLSLADLVRFYPKLAGALRPGGVLLDGDRVDFDHDQQAIAERARDVDPAWHMPDHDAPASDMRPETWDEWWSAIGDSGEFDAALDERRRRRHDHPHADELRSYEFQRAALLSAGFSEVGTIWQHWVNRVLIAVR